MTITQRPIVKNPVPVASHLVSVPIILLRDIMQEEPIEIVNPEYAKYANCWPHGSGVAFDPEIHMGREFITFYSRDLDRLLYRHGYKYCIPDISSRAHIKCTVKWIGKTEQEAMEALCRIDGVDYASAFIQWGGYRDSGRWYKWRPWMPGEKGGQRLDWRSPFTPLSEVVWSMWVGGQMFVGRTA